MRTRRYSITLILAAAFFLSACVKKISLPELLPVQPEVPTDELVRRVNELGRLETFGAQGWFYVINYFTGKGNRAERFPYANVVLRIRRPGSLRMNVSAPVIGKKVAEMATDSHEFQLALYYPEDKKRFVHGENLRDVERMAAEQLRTSKDAEIARAGGLVNMRPQHIADAFLIRPVNTGDRYEVFREEFRQVEEDTVPNKGKRKVERTYSILYAVERDENGQLALRRKFWFDRTRPGTPMVRQQTFENHRGRLTADITYDEWTTVPDSDWKWARKIVIDRRADGYRLELSLEGNSMDINSAIPDEAFRLQNTEALQEVNLDAPHTPSKAGSPQAPPPRQR